MLWNYLVVYVSASEITYKRKPRFLHHFPNTLVPFGFTRYWVGMAKYGWWRLRNLGLVGTLSVADRWRQRWRLTFLRTSEDFTSNKSLRSLEIGSCITTYLDVTIHDIPEDSFPPVSIACDGMVHSNTSRSVALDNINHGLRGLDREIHILW